MDLYSVDFGGKEVQFTPSKHENLPDTVSNEHFTLVRKMKDIPILIDQWLHFGNGNCVLMFNGHGQVIDYHNGEARIIHLTPAANVNLTLKLLERHACPRCAEKLPVHVVEGGFSPDYEHYMEDYGVCSHLVTESHVCPQLPTMKLGNTTVCTKCAEVCVRCHQTVPATKICDFSPQYCYQQSWISRNPSWDRPLPSGYLTADEISTAEKAEQCPTGCGDLIADHQKNNWQAEHTARKSCDICLQIMLSDKCGHCGEPVSNTHCEKCTSILWRCILCQHSLCVNCDDCEQRPHDDHMGTYCASCVRLGYRVCTTCHQEMIPDPVSCANCAETLNSMTSETTCRHSCSCKI